MFLCRESVIFLWLLSGFLLYLWFSESLKMICPHVDCVGIYPDVLWASWICALVSGFNLGKFSVTVFFPLFLCSFLSSISFWYSHYTYVMYFGIVLQSLDIMLCFLQSFFSFLFWRFLATCPQAHRVFPHLCIVY